MWEPNWFDKLHSICTCLQLISYFRIFYFCVCQWIAISLIFGRKTWNKYMVMIDSMSKYCCWWFEVGLSEVFSQPNHFILVSFLKLDELYCLNSVLLSCYWANERYTSSVMNHESFRFRQNWLMTVKKSCFDWKTRIHQCHCNSIQ